MLDILKVCLGVFCLSAVWSQDLQQVTGIVGESITFEIPNLLTNPEINWRFSPISASINANLTVRINNRKIETVYEERFKTRLQLVNNTDSLRINNLHEADSGFYQVEDFGTNRFLKKFQLTVYKPVPKPHVKKMDGNVELGNRTCTLLCSVGGPSGVTVSWMRDGKSLNTTQLKLTQGCNVTYTCVASNPASNQTVTVTPSDYCLDKGHGAVTQCNHYIVIIALCLSWLSL
ncbi:SLAM family member 5-like [Acipenser ruthenus]|uniref:SLAM family member 5-like n=1 Tax=Acipenser ruthenus TaxID=7906 RepID=UPI0027428D1B|nr:SLAM family member 5-like [Acipenser ruthenus]XP_058864068.1 SLAM family member 5-like [Acipenser ruthenus]